MSEFPLQHIEIEDFRRLSGLRSYNLDAPVVLIHGPNGSGKTSILSALELGLTGQVSGLDDGDIEQYKHLPHTEASGATVRVDVRPDLGPRVDRERVTVSRTRGVSGPSAFGPKEARFYRERCYLDQASLGRLLEIYQDTDKAKESVLARFVNELLGLEQLDALRDGLADAKLVTKLRKRAEQLGTADQKKKDAALRRTERTRALTDAQAALGKARDSVVAALIGLGHPVSVDDSAETLLDLARRLTGYQDLHATKQTTSAAYRELLDLGGQLNAIRQSATAQDLTSLDEAANVAEANLIAWATEHKAAIDNWDSAASDAGFAIPAQGREAAVQTALAAAKQKLESQALLRGRVKDAEDAFRAAQQALDAAQASYDDAKERASTLVEGLVALRPHIQENNCPVCDRSYNDVGGDLGEHVDTKIRQLAEHSQRLLDLRGQRETFAADLTRREADLNQARSRLLPTDQYAEALDQTMMLQDLADALITLQPTIERGDELITLAAAARRAHRDLQSATTVNNDVAKRLQQIAQTLNLTLQTDHPLREQQQHLSEIAARQVSAADVAIEASTRLEVAATNLNEALAREADASRLVSEANLDEGYWGERVKEGAHRHQVAKELHDGAERARSSIIQRVFTNELNSLWRDLFTRLAPNEMYVPAFGVVTSDKSVEPQLVTRHKNGDTSGTPRLMLSAGNLNTAALSLFLALHLSVKSDVPCLVFDDPVQAMDEVHVSQFAALIRTLSKDLNRQVVIAVHERELFDYLSLELSPAFPGDELITIRLGGGSTPDDGWKRELYRPDTTIAI